MNASQLLLYIYINEKLTSADIISSIVLLEKHLSITSKLRKETKKNIRNSQQKEAFLLLKND